MSIIQWIINERLATNQFAAAHIANGLKLAGLQPEEQQARVKLYRDWRNSQAFPKSDTASCYKMAIEGKAAPAPLFDGALHSEAE